jgi:hypothetical protein
VLCGRAFATLLRRARRAAQLGRVCGRARRRPLRRAFDALAAVAALRLARRRALVSTLCIALARHDRLALGRAFDVLAADSALRCAALRLGQRGALARALRAADRQRGARRSALLLHGLRQIRRSDRHEAAVRRPKCVAAALGHMLLPSPGHMFFDGGICCFPRYRRRCLSRRSPRRRRTRVPQATRRDAAALLRAARAALEAAVHAALAGAVRHWAAQAAAVAALERKCEDDERACERAAKALAEELARRAAAEELARRAAVEDAALQRIAHATYVPCPPAGLERWPPSFWDDGRPPL